MDIIEFLTARLDEDEADARAAIADRSGTERWEAKGFPERDRVEWIVRDVEEKYASHGYPGYTVVASAMPGGPRDGGGVAAHIARHDPARVLREVEAKRRVLARHSGFDFPANEDDGPGDYAWTAHSDGHCYGATWPCAELRDLAAPYADHPDYDPTWAVTS